LRNAHIIMCPRIRHQNTFERSPLPEVYPSLHNNQPNTPRNELPNMKIRDLRNSTSGNHNFFLNRIFLRKFSKLNFACDICILGLRPCLGFEMVEKGRVMYASSAFFTRRGFEWRFFVLRRRRHGTACSRKMFGVHWNWGEAS
jgi:hypothetical protein